MSVHLLHYPVLSLLSSNLVALYGRNKLPDTHVALFAEIR